jgi:hypothetical protein
MPGCLIPFESLSCKRHFPDIIGLLPNKLGIRGTSSSSSHSEFVPRDFVIPPSSSPSLHPAPRSSSSLIIVSFQPPLGPTGFFSIEINFLRLSPRIKTHLGGRQSIFHLEETGSLSNRLGVEIC